MRMDFASPYLSHAHYLRIPPPKKVFMSSPPKHFDRNLIVIGGGAAGLVSAYIAATVKAKVTLVEHNAMGGDCLNYGCVPSKALIKAAKVAHTISQSNNYGIHGTIDSIDFQAVMRSVQQAIERIEPHDSPERYTDLGVEVIKGFARIIDPWHVSIESASAPLENTKQEPHVRTLSTRSIILATGAAPIVPNIPGLQSVPHFTSETLWRFLAGQKALPKSLLVLGGGPIGCELAQAFSRLGSHVTLVDRGDRILKSEDTEAAESVRHALIADGVAVRLNTSVVEARCAPAGSDCSEFDLQSKRDTELETIAAELIILAVGRRARLKGYGLKELGINEDKALNVDAFMRTEVDTIYAAGDVAGRYQFTHVAAHEAWYASVNSLFGFVKKFKADYRAIPRAIYTQPEVARAGSSQDELEAQDIQFDETVFDLGDLDRTLLEMGNNDKGVPAGAGVELAEPHRFVKVLTVPGKDTILGVTIVADTASEMLPEFVTAIKFKHGLNDILGTIHAYPTFAEGNKYAAGEWKKANKPAWLLWIAERLHRFRR